VQREKLASVQHGGPIGNCDHLSDHDLGNELLQGAQEKAASWHHALKLVVSVHHVEINDPPCRWLPPHFRQGFTDSLVEA